MRSPIPTAAASVLQNLNVGLFSWRYGLAGTARWLSWPDVPASSPVACAMHSECRIYRDDMNTIDEQTIRERAYEMWEAQGRPQGSQDDDWFAAEAELMAERDAASGPLEPLAADAAAVLEFELDANPEVRPAVKSRVESNPRSTATNP